MGYDAMDNQPFRFFDLPPELRNMVYDNLKEWVDCPPYRDCEGSTPRHYHPGIFVTSPGTLERLVPHLRLVNRQFQTEAETQVSKSITFAKSLARHLFFTEPWHESSWFSRRLHEITNLDLTVSIDNYDIWPQPFDEPDECERTRCWDINDLDYCVKWVGLLSKNLPNLKKADISLHFECDVKYGVCWPVSQCALDHDERWDEFTQFPFLASFKVFECNHDGTPERLIPSRGLRAMWDRKSGWHALKTGDVGLPVARISLETLRRGFNERPDEEEQDGEGDGIEEDDE